MKPEEALNSVMGTTKSRKYQAIKSEEEIVTLIEEIVARAQKGLKLVEDNDKYSFMRDTVMDIIAILHSAKYQITQE